MTISALETEFYKLLDQDDLAGAEKLLEQSLEPLPSKDQTSPFKPAVRLAESLTHVVVPLIMNKNVVYFQRKSCALNYDPVPLIVNLCPSY